MPTQDAVRWSRSKQLEESSRAGDAQLDRMMPEIDRLSCEDSTVIVHRIEGGLHTFSIVTDDIETYFEGEYHKIGGSP